MEAAAGNAEPELVDDDEELELAAIRGGVELEVHCPHDDGSDRAHRTDVDADTGETLPFAALQDPQSFGAPQTRDVLLLTFQPARRAILAARRHPQRGRVTAHRRSHSA